MKIEDRDFFQIELNVSDILGAVEIIEQLSNDFPPFEEKNRNEFLENIFKLASLSRILVEKIKRLEDSLERLEMEAND